MNGTRGFSRVLQPKTNAAEAACTIAYKQIESPR